MSKTEVLLSEIGLPDKGPEHSDLLRTLLLCYLVDWKSAVETGRQFTNSDWRNADWGPVSKEILTAIFREDGDGEKDAVSDVDKKVMAFVLNDWKKASLDDLRKVVTSTYPFIVSRPGAHLNLESLAEKYKSDFRSGKNASLEAS